ncbi:hypothetical protein [Leptospira noguchii]|uniref:Uncharacterized protein n=1 Tax=Leptospira noguchii TaxID=28182 RepID=A0A9Q8RC64_9LEPT|nr:hypothetical protein [Leptospira noguchii]EKR74210.1 hypothetical protein LEP1GSC041_2093 [Leptospira noguchii str. 2006001870]EMI65970.1 hypothetical protein LEP1GSC072_2743 [Leptospira noguchii str. Bonito]EMS82786.1 hypothetical protein LEP1GSC073_0324 [Leptospira noguchii str. Cascata]EMS83874.1 hypothetical protein LEP1GSC074_3552 [Leptospira noguchii str. Hook]TQE78534.1 hypothetical protein FF021_06630 [Leptospira noguchii]
MNLQILFIGVFVVVAFAISALCGFLIGNSFGHVLLVTFISMISFAVLGFGVHSILETKVPEFLDFLSNIGGEYVPSAHATDSENVVKGRDYTSNASDTDVAEGSSNSEVFASATPKRQKDGNFGDHIMVENIAIKNEPKLMAEAIRTMLARDDMGEK